MDPYFRFFSLAGISHIREQLLLLFRSIHSWVWTTTADDGSSSVKKEDPAFLSSQPHNVSGSFLAPQNRRKKRLESLQFLALRSFADSFVNLRLPQKKAAQSSRKTVGGWVLPTFYGGRRVNKFLPHRRQIPVSEENSAFPTKVGGGGYSNE